MKPQITLIQPPVTDSTYPDMPFSIEPLSLLVLASLTPRDRYDLRIIDGALKGEKNAIIDPDSALVGITVVTPVSDSAYDIARRYRQLGIPVVLGGAHVTLAPKEAKEHADSIVVGEAESVWPALLNDFANGELKPEYRAEEPPAFEVEIDRSVITNYRRKYPFISIIQTTRGCPNDCEFCVVASTYGRRIRHRSIESVIQEVQSVQRHLKRNTFGFTDDNFFGDRAYAKKLLNALIPLKIRWASQMCIDIAEDEELLGLMAESGCFAALFGFESINQAALQEAGKELETSRYPALIQRVRDRGILVIGTFTIGYDADKESVYDDTLAFCRETGIEVPLFITLMPYKGTCLFDRLVKEGRIDRGARPGSNPLALNFAPRRLQPARVEANIIRMYREYYNWSYVVRNLKHWFKRSHYKRCLLLIGFYLLYLAFARRIGKGTFRKR
ncbi:MAG: B12-binding domain-containing radical SAM protein [Lentisphaerales bacterium]|jgi:radical SAM superfamily enzyme YgiQ (UPF0313 family)|nr:MAG: B12-binding domain-containing radical SAM protein [Lentisphaerales bacterium]